MNKNRITLLLVLGLIFVNSYLFAENDGFVSKEEAEIVKKIEETPRSDNNIPSFMKGFTSEHIPSNVTIGRKEEDTDEKILEIAKKYKPANFEDYAKVFCPQIIKETKKTKQSIPPTLEQLTKMPGMPKFKILRDTVRFWSCWLRLMLEEEGNDNAALVVTYAGYYLAKDLESSYAGSGDLLSKNLAIGFCGISSNELLLWANKPRNKSAKLSKYLAKDLIELVNNEYPFSSCIKFDKALIYSVCYEAAKNGNDNTKSFIDIVLKSNYFKECIDLFYVLPKKFIDKPYYICKKELEDYESKAYKKQDEISQNLKDLSKKVEELQQNSDSFDESKINPEWVIKIFVGQIFSMGSVCYSQSKKSHEIKLAKMEMVAIALAYNAYYCENNKEPANMEELENWFGEKMPVNRFTDKPYVLNSEKGYALYNYGIEDKKDDEKNEMKSDFFFKFSAK